MGTIVNFPQTQNRPMQSASAIDMTPKVLARVMPVREGQTAVSRPSDQDTASIENARRQRRRALILPREHGAWGLLLVPMVTGFGVALRQSTHVLPAFLLLTAALALFWLRTPLESLLGTSAMRAQNDDEQDFVASVAAGLAAVAAIAITVLLWNGKNPELWLIGVISGLAFVIQGLLKKSRSTRMISEIIGTVGLTSAAPATYYVMTGKFDAAAITLWLANLLFAGDQIHYVQLRIHTARVEGLRAKLERGWAFALGQALMTAAVTLACVFGFIPALASLAFAPLLYRGWFYFIQKPGPLAVRRLGWTELTQAVLFCLLFIAFYVPPSVG